MTCAASTVNEPKYIVSERESVCLTVRLRVLSVMKGVRSSQSGSLNPFLLKTQRQSSKALEEVYTLVLQKNMRPLG